MTGADSISVPAQSQSLKEISGLSKMGDKKVSDLVGEDFRITWDGTKGTAEGSVHNVKEAWTQFDKTDNTGHFIVLAFDEKYTGKKNTVEATKKTTSTDLGWVVKIDAAKEAGKPIKLSSDGQPVAEIDISSLVLEE